MTTKTLQVVGLLLSDPEAEWYGLQIASEAGLKSGSVYVVLARLEQAGWLASHWEEIDPAEEGRPRRRLYTLTGEGRRAANEAFEQQLAALTAARTSRAAPARRPGMSPT